MVWRTLVPRSRVRYTARAHAQPRPRHPIERRLTRLRARGMLLLLGLAGCGTPPDGWLYATRVGSTSAVIAWTGFGATLRCDAEGHAVLGRGWVAKLDEAAAARGKVARAVEEQVAGHVERVRERLASIERRLELHDKKT